MSDRSAKIKEAVELRKNDQPEEALKTLEDLLSTYPEDPDVNYQMAWTCDFMGKEAEAVPYYVKAIANGLKEDREGAMLGLGSTYRCLGEYPKSLVILEQAITEFPESGALKTFRALTLHNLDRHEECAEVLLTQLLDTTTDASIKSYERALRFYSDKLNKVW